MSDATALVTERVDKLLADVDPKAVDDVTFRGRQYDLGLAWVHFPEGYGGLGLPPAAQREVDRRVHAAGAAHPGPRHFFGLALAGPTIVTQRRRGRQAAPAASDVHRRGRLVPAVQRAGRRLRPRRARHPGRARRRRVGHHRPEGVEHARPHRGPGHARGPHRPRGPQAQGPHLLRPRHARPRRRGPAAAPDHRRGRVQRGLHDRGAGARRRPHRRRRRGLAGVDDHAHERAHHASAVAAPACRPAARVRSPRRCASGTRRSPTRPRPPATAS